MQLFHASAECKCSSCGELIVAGSLTAVDNAWGGALAYFYHVTCLVPAAGIPKLAPMKSVELARVDDFDSPLAKGGTTNPYEAAKLRLLGVLPVVRAHLQAVALDLFFLLLLAGFIYGSYARLSPFAGILVGFCLVCGIAFWLSGATPGMRLLQVEQPLGIAARHPGPKRKIS